MGDQPGRPGRAHGGSGQLSGQHVGPRGEPPLASCWEPSRSWSPRPVDLPRCALIVARGAQVTSSLLPTLHHSSSFPARPYGSPRGSPRGGQSPRTMTANGTRSTDLISEGVKVRKLKEALRDCTTMLQGERQVRPFAVPPPPHGRRPSRSVLTLSNKSARLACATSSPTWIYAPPSKASVFPPRAPMNTWRS